MGKENRIDSERVAEGGTSSVLAELCFVQTTGEFKLSTPQDIAIELACKTVSRLQEIVDKSDEQKARVLALLSRLMSQSADAADWIGSYTKDAKELGNPVLAERAVAADRVLDHATSDVDFAGQFTEEELQAGCRNFLEARTVEALFEPDRELELAEAALSIYCMITQPSWRDALFLSLEEQLRELASYPAVEEFLSGLTGLSEEMAKLVRHALADARPGPRLDDYLEGSASFGQLKENPIVAEVHRTVEQGARFFTTVAERGPELRVLLRDTLASLVNEEPHAAPSISPDRQLSWDGFAAQFGLLTPAEEVSAERIRKTLSGLVKDSERDRIAEFGPSSQLAELLQGFDFALNDQRGLVRALAYYLNRLEGLSTHRTGLRTLRSIKTNSTDRALRSMAQRALHERKVHLREGTLDRKIAGKVKQEKKGIAPDGQRFVSRPPIGSVPGLYVFVCDLVSAFSGGHRLRDRLARAHSQVCKSAMCEDLPGQDFVPLFLDLASSTERLAQKRERDREKIQPSIEQAKEMLIRVIRETPRDSVARLITPGRWVKGLMASNVKRLSPDRQILEPGDIISRDGLSTALEQVCDEADSTRAKILVECLLRSFTDDVEAQPQLIERVMIGGLRQSTNLARVIWLLGTSADFDVKAKLCCALLHACEQNEAFFSIVRNPRELLELVARQVVSERSILELAKNPAQELAEIVRGFRDGMRLLTGPEEGLPPGAMRLSHLAHQAYGEDAETQISELLSELMRGEFLDSLEEQGSFDRGLLVAPDRIRPQDRLIPEGRLPPANTAPGIHLSLLRAAPINRSDVLFQDQLVAVCRTIVGKSKESSPARYLPADQILPLLLRIHEMLGMLEDGESCSQLVEAAIVRVAQLSIDGKALLQKRVGRSPDGHIVYDFRRDKSSVLLGSRDGLTALFDEFRQHLHTEAQHMLSQGVLSEKDERAFRRRGVLLARSLIQALDGSELKHRLPTTRLCPLDGIVVSIHLIHSLDPVFQKEASDAVLTALLQLGMSRAAYDLELRSLMEPTQQSELSTVLESQYSLLGPHLDQRTLLSGVLDSWLSYCATYDGLELTDESRYARRLVEGWLSNKKVRELVLQLLKPEETDALAVRKNQLIREIVSQCAASEAGVSALDQSASVASDGVLPHQVPLPARERGRTAYSQFKSRVGEPDKFGRPFGAQGLFKELRQVTGDLRSGTSPRNLKRRKQLCVALAEVSRQIGQEDSLEFSIQTLLAEPALLLVMDSLAYGSLDDAVVQTALERAAIALIHHGREVDGARLGWNTTLQLAKALEHEGLKVLGVDDYQKQTIRRYGSGHDVFFRLRDDFSSPEIVRAAIELGPLIYESPYLEDVPWRDQIVHSSKDLIEDLLYFAAACERTERKVIAVGAAAHIAVHTSNQSHFESLLFGKRSDSGMDNFSALITEYIAQKRSNLETRVSSAKDPRLSFLTQHGEAVVQTGPAAIFSALLCFASRLEPESTRESGRQEARDFIRKLIESQVQRRELAEIVVRALQSEDETVKRFAEQLIDRSREVIPLKELSVYAQRLIGLTAMSPTGEPDRDVVVEPEFEPYDPLSGEL